MGTANAAGAAFQAAFVGYADSVLFQSIHICRAEVKARLIRTFFQAHGTIQNPQVGFFMHAEPIQEEFVFYLHLTLLHPSPKILSSLRRGIFRRRFWKRALCFSFLGIPFTVSISLAAWLAHWGNEVKSSRWVSRN